MDQQAEIWISRAERAWLKPIEAHITHLFSGIYLPSHDHTHHRRVWHLCRQLIREIGQYNQHFDYKTVEGILIASWFHDVGMIHSTDEKHGAAGSDMCKAFFPKERDSRPEAFDEVLEAILKHDQKEDRIYAGIVKEQRPEILSILSIADDLEALGTIGIYRYTEIYLERGIPPGELGERVIRNANKRFRRLSGCRLCGNLINAYGQQWKELTSFFREYTRQIGEDGDPSLTETGPLGVVNHIRTLGLSDHIRPEVMADRIRQNGSDRFVKEFFTRLQDELEKARL